MRALIACGLMLQTTLGLTTPARTQTPPMAIEHAAYLAEVSDRPTAAEVRTALETLKRSGVPIEVKEAPSPFHYTGKAAKYALISAGVMIVSRIAWDSHALAQVIAVLTSISTPILIVVAGVTGIVETVIYLSTPAHASDLEDGILANAELLDRYLKLPVDIQMQIGGPRLQRLAIDLARPLEQAPPR